MGTSFNGRCSRGNICKQRIQVSRNSIHQSTQASEFKNLNCTPPFKTQLLKWIGNKQKFAHEIIAHFPSSYATYREPFLGSGAVMATLGPKRAVGSDAFPPLIEIWQALSRDRDALKEWYRVRYARYMDGDRVMQYEKIKASYNQRPNGPDLLFLSRSCYGGVVRFRKKDGYMSTPCGAHKPISPQSFARRVDIWAHRIEGARFELADFTKSMAQARPGDLVYCDPPYSDSQTILYGAQQFRLQNLFDAVRDCKKRGVYVAVSLDRSKKSGRRQCTVDLPDGLFQQDISVNTGRSMLRRFQMGGETLEEEQVQDRLLLTFPPR